MDRRFRTILSLGAGALLVAGVTAARSDAQPSPGSPNPAGAAATPWVQSPPAANEPPPPAPALPGTVPPTSGTATPKPAVKAQTGGLVLPGGGPHPGGPGQAGTVEDTKLKMERERKRELAVVRKEQAPDEQKTFEQNMRLWDRMAPEERRAMVEVVGGRMRVEMDEAYRRSGLNLNAEQREMFDLRYRQERRKVEREVQEVARRERERRLPAVDEQLRKEFGRASAANMARAATSPAAAAVTPAPQPTPTPAETPAVAPSKA